MSYVLELQFPVELVTRNKLDRMHFMKRHKYFKSIYSIIYYQALKEGLPKSLLPKVNLKIIYFTHREQDPDNFVASLKPFIDGLKAKHGRIITDDSNAVIMSLDASQVVIKKTDCSRMLIRVEEIVSNQA